MTDQPETTEGVARDLSKLMDEATLLTRRLADRGASVPDVAMLSARMNLLIESAFGPIDYQDLTGDGTEGERLMFERAFQQARVRMLRDGLVQLEQAGPPDLAVPTNRGLILP